LNIVAKVRRTLPDTAFNFQFIVDAFAVEKKKRSDTADSPPLKLNISNISLENVRLTYDDVVTGSDMYARIGNLTATIDTLDPYIPVFNIPTIIARNVQARVIQRAPLTKPEPVSKDVAEALTPNAARFHFGTIDLTRFSIQFENDVSAFYTSLNLGKLRIDGRLTDLQNNRIYLKQLVLDQSKTAIRLGKKEEARIVEKEIKQEVAAQKAAGWDFRVDHLEVNNNTIQFDNDNNPRMLYGIDYSHFRGDSVTINLDNFVLNSDSVMGTVNNASFREKSGFVLEQLSGEILHASSQTYFRNLHLETPGSLVRRNALIEYPDRQTLSKNFEQAVMDLEIVDSRVQVKDILAFAPQLRSHPAMQNPYDTWYLNVVGNGTLNRLVIETLEFDGLRNTQVSASGTLSGLMKPTSAGGRLTIQRLHTNQTDISLFTGSRLSTKEINLPEEFDVSGSIAGNAGTLQADLDISTSSGFVAVNGSFGNLASPAGITYNTAIQANRLNLGSIMRNPRQFGFVTGNFVFNGRGLTPASMNTRFRARMATFGLNGYQYRNVAASGTLRNSRFDIRADAQDPNADFTVTASGSMAGTSSFRVNGFVDSLKTQPLGFTPQSLVFRGRIDADIVSLNDDYLVGEMLITDALLVSPNDRVPLDSVHVVSGRTDTGQFIRLRSDIANADLQGQYRIADLPKIIENSIQPYFEVTTNTRRIATAPYRFTFTADVVYTPLLSSFVPELEKMETLHAEGTFETNEGMTGSVRTPFISYNGNELTNLDLRVATTPQGLRMIGTADRIKSGNSFDLYRTRIDATAMNNVIDFNVGTDDA
ncbi:MAG TPA: hypothetical protein VFZ78_01530, partial [Flavisolibacter sp.]